MLLSDDLQSVSFRLMRIEFTIISHDARGGEIWISQSGWSVNRIRFSSFKNGVSFIALSMRPSSLSDFATPTMEATRLISDIVISYAMIGIMVYVIFDPPRFNFIHTVENLFRHNRDKDIIYNYIIQSFDIMDFSAETPEEKKIRLGGVVKVVERVLPAIAPFVPALQPVAAVVGAVSSLRK